MAKKESNDRVTENSPKYRIREFQGYFFPEALRKVATAYISYYEYQTFMDAPGKNEVFFYTIDEAKQFIRYAHKGEVIHSFDPETE